MGYLMQHVTSLLAHGRWLIGIENFFELDLKFLINPGVVPISALVKKLCRVFRLELCPDWRAIKAQLLLLRYIPSRKTRQAWLRDKGKHGLCCQIRMLMAFKQARSPKNMSCASRSVPVSFKGTLKLDRRELVPFTFKRKYRKHSTIFEFFLSVLVAKSLRLTELVLKFLFRR